MIRFVFELQRFDTYTVTKSNTFLKGTSGNDTFSNSSYYWDVTINGGAGNDSVYNTGNDALIIGGAGNDSIYNSYGYYATISGDAGNDVIDSSGDYVTINGGAGNDKISITSSASWDDVIIGGKGNDTIYGTNRTSYGYNYRYANGDGYDLIYNFGSDDTLTFTSGYYTNSTIGANVIFYSYENKKSKSPNGAITLVGAAGIDIAVEGFHKDETVKTGIIDSRLSYSSVKGTSGNDIVNNSGSNVTILSYGGNDSIYNSGYDVAIDAGAGNDSIYNEYVNDISVSGGDGDDSINNYSAWYSEIEAGDGNDTILASYRAYKNIIDGGAGNDKISLQSSSDQYDGGNTIGGGIGDDTIYGGSNTAATIGNIYAYGFGDGNDHIYNFNSIDKILLGNGLSSYSTTSSGSDVIVNVQDGKITLHNAKNKTVNIAFYAQNTVSSSKFEGTSNNDIMINSGSSSKIFGYAGNDSIYDEGYRTTIDAGAGNDTITDYYSGYSSLNGGAGNDVIDSSGDYVTINGGAGNDKISITSAYVYDNVIIGGKGNDTIFGADRTSTYSSSYGSYGYNYRYANGDGYDLIYNVSSLDTITFTSGYYSKKTSGSNVILYSYSNKNPSVANGRITLMGAAGKTFTIKGKKKPVDSWTLKDNQATYKSGGKTLATISGAKSLSGISGPQNKKVTLKNSALKNKVTVGGSYEFDFASDYNNATITGSTSNDSITARGSKVKIYGGAGTDSIKMYGSNLTVSGGNGADTFVYEMNGSKAKITDFGTSDTLKIGENGKGAYSTSTSGQNIIVTVDDGGEITLAGAANLSDVNIKGDFKPIDNDGIILKGKNATLTGNYEKASFALDGDYKNIWNVDASEVKLGLKISGNQFANSIIGSSQDDTINGEKGGDIIKGGEGSDSIIGGENDDSIYGGAGNDTYAYSKGDGNDVIFDYEEDDRIKISGDKIREIKNSGNDVIFTLETANKITVKGGANKLITYSVDGNEKTYIADLNKYVTFNSKFTAATLKANYPTSSFTSDEYGTYSSTLETIDSSAIRNSMTIVGNNKANYIIGSSQDDTINGGDGGDIIRGGDGNDSIFGGNGNDNIFGGEGKNTLWGGAGDDSLTGSINEADVFYYNIGEGNDTIYGYDSALDRIILRSGTVENVASDDNGNVVFKVGDGKIVVDGGKAMKSIKIVDTSGNTLKEWPV